MNIRFAGRAFYPDYKATHADAGKIRNQDTILVSDITVALNDHDATHKTTFELLQQRVEEAMDIVGRLPIAIDEYIEKDVKLRQVRAQLWDDFTDPKKLVSQDELAKYSRDFLSKDVFRQLEITSP
jgi:hypothetical protein